VEQILSEYTVSITELRKAPGELLKQAAGQTVAILSHNKPAGYIVSPEAYRTMLEAIEDKALGKIVEQRKGSLRKAKVVKLDDL
jgi:antitoxin StbD